MIELPDRPKPNRMKPVLLDRGQILRGASSLRVDRPGNRWRIEFAYPPMRQAQADAFTAPLTRAKRIGVRVYLPVRVPQGNPGSAVVNGSGQSGTTLAVRSLSGNYLARAGFWFTLVDGAGRGYLHRIVVSSVASSSGNATWQIEPPLREPFADGAAVHIAEPFIEGFIDGQEWGYDIQTNEFTDLSLTVEEYR